MNFLQDRIKTGTNDLTIETFRKFQYDNIHYFSNVLINFLSRLGVNHLSLKQSDFVDLLNYRGLYNSQFSEYSIKINENPNQNFFKVYLPKLIDQYFFFLNGNYYIPCIYAIDYPIICKNESIKLTALINSITLYMKDDIVVFIGHNIPLSMFLQLFLHDDSDAMELYNEFISKKNLNHEFHDKENLISFFKSKFNSETEDEIKQKIESLFLDDYSIELYKTCYGFEVNLKNILKKALWMYVKEEVPEFIDLNNKRLVFLEILLRPILDKISGVSLSISRGQKLYSMETDLYAIIKYFLKSPDTSSTKKSYGLGGDYIYDLQNLYSTILQHKISLIPPGIERPPKEIRNIHSSHYKKICPITISNQNPGALVSLVPGTKLDFFGRFIE